MKEIDSESMTQIVGGENSCVICGASTLAAGFSGGALIAMSPAIAVSCYQCAAA